MGDRKATPHRAEIDAMRPAAQLIVIATHALIFFAPMGSLTVMEALTLTRVSRQSFFFISALVMTLAYGAAADFAGRYVRRRLSTTLVPYVAWSFIYWVFTSLPQHTGFPFYGFSFGALLSTSGLHQLATYLFTGYYHLYFLVVLFQFYVVFPFVVGWLKRNPTRHWLVVVLALVAQVALDLLARKGWMVSWYSGKTETRLITSYPLYLVGGIVVGLNYERCLAWVRRNGSTVVTAAVFLGVAAVSLDHVAIGVTAHYLAPSGDAFAATAVPYNVAAIVTLWWLADLVLRRFGTLAPAARRLGDDAFGVYLSQMIWIPVLVRTAQHFNIEKSVPWPALVVAAIVATFALGLFATEALRHTPLSRVLFGRERLVLTGD